MILLINILKLSILFLLFGAVFLVVCIGNEVNFEDGDNHVPEGMNEVIA